MDFSHEWKAMSVGLANKLKTLDRRRMQDANRHTARSLVGTPNYIAPEVLLREGDYNVILSRVLIFSLGPSNAKFKN